MRTPLFQLKDLLDVFRHKKVLTKRELLQGAGCSAMTAWRLLSKHGYYTSYNFNARYYTLADTPQFDEHGLWTYRKIRFSKWGSLTETIVALVGNSEAGMTPEQLQQQLKIANVRPALSKLIQEDRIKREEVSGHSVFFPLKKTSRQQQRKRRIELIVESAPALPPLEHILALLVEMIQRPRNSPPQWARRLGRQGIRLPVKDIQVILNHYGIDLKKGLFTS